MAQENGFQDKIEVGNTEKTVHRNKTLCTSCGIIFKEMEIMKNHKKKKHGTKKLKLY